MTNSRTNTTGLYLRFRLQRSFLESLAELNRGTFVAGLAGILISWPVSGFLPMCAVRAGLTLMNILPIFPSVTCSPLITPALTTSNRSSGTCFTSLLLVLVVVLILVGAVHPEKWN